jgi:large subunit ribosomal protein L13e
MPQTSPPVPLVPRFVHGAHKLRKARGFSLGELKQAGLLRSQARSIGIRVDERRSTVHSQNVSMLTRFLAPTAQVNVPPETAVEAPAVAPEAKKGPERAKGKAERTKKPVRKRKH